MNKLKFLLLPFAVACSLLMVGCSDDGDEPDDIIWDFVNYSVNFYVSDPSGNNLLNKNHPVNILDNDIVVKYREKKFKIEMPSEKESRATYVMPFGLRYSMNNYNPEGVLSFGEFSPTRDYKGEEFTIEWGDGTVDKIKLDLFITWKKEDPTIHKAIYLNGELHSDKSFDIHLVKEVKKAG